MFITYNGKSDVRIISSADFTAAGLTSVTRTWNKANGFSIDLPPDIAAFCLAQGEFYAESGAVFGDIIEGGGGAESPLVLTANGPTEVPMTINGDLSQTAPHFRVVGTTRAGPGDESAGRYRVHVDQFCGIETNAAIMITTDIWTGPNKDIPAAFQWLGAGVGLCFGIRSDVAGPAFYEESNGVSDYFLFRDLNGHAVGRYSVPPGSAGTGAWLGIGDDPIGTLTLSDKHDGAATGGTIYTTLWLRHGNNASSAKISTPSTSILEISNNAKSGENAFAEMIMRLDSNEGVVWYSAATPAGDRTELFRLLPGQGPTLQSAAATAGSPDKNSPTMWYRSAYWNGSTSVIQGFQVKDQQWGGGAGHSLWFTGAETNTTTLALGPAGHVGIGWPFPSASRGMLNVVSSATTTAAVILDTPSGQTEDIQKWRKNGVELGRFLADGSIRLPVAGSLIPSPSASSTAIKESIRLPYTSAITSTNKVGEVVNLVGVTLFPDGSMPYTKGWMSLGDNNLNYIHCLAPLDLAGQPIIDMNFIGNSEGLYNPRLSQALDSTVGAYNTLTVGISTMPVGGVGYLSAIDRLVFNSGQSVANSKATFKNLGSVELLSDTMALKFGVAGDASLSYLAAGVKVTGSGGLLCNIFQDTATAGTYFEFAGGKLLVQPRGATPALELAVRTQTMASVAANAGLRVPHGTAPTSPVDGDIWTTSAGMFVRINGVTKSVNLT